MTICATLALLPGCGLELDEDLRLGEQARAIVGGMVSTAWPAVGTVNTGCTGTLIHPHVVLTAAHCCYTHACTSFELEGPAAGRSTVLRSIRHPKYTVNADGGVAPSYDLQVLVLARPVTDVTPMLLSSLPPAKGRAITFVGYGCTDLVVGGGVGTKRVGKNVISLVGDSVNLDEPVRFKDTFAWEAEGTYASANTCPGDSGGPTLWTEGTKARVAGVHTLVGPSFGYSTSVTARRDWIVDQLPECTLGDEQPCGDCGARVCDAKTLTWSSRCTAPAPTPQRSCPGGEQRCGADGNWGACEPSAPAPTTPAEPSPAGPATPAAAQPANADTEPADPIDVVGACAITAGPAGSWPPIALVLIALLGGRRRYLRWQRQRPPSQPQA